MNSLRTLFSSPDPAALTKDEATFYIEAWKKTIDVQQHFNDLSWRIRALWLTALTFTLGATFFAYKDAKVVPMGFLGDKSPALLVPLLGLFLWVAFWFVDAAWYHRLLVGSVKEGARLEKVLTGAGREVGLTKAIGDSSPVTTFVGVMHSKHKLNVFYILGGLPLLATVGFLLLVSSGAAPTPVP